MVQGIVSEQEHTSELCHRGEVVIGVGVDEIGSATHKVYTVREARLCD